MSAEILPFPKPRPATARATDRVLGRSREVGFLAVPGDLVLFCTDDLLDLWEVWRAAAASPLGEVLTVADGRGRTGPLPELARRPEHLICPGDWVPPGASETLMGERHHGLVAALEAFRAVVRPPGLPQKGGA